MQVGAGADAEADRRADEEVTEAETPVEVARDNHEESSKKPTTERNDTIPL